MRNFLRTRHGRRQRTQTRTIFISRLSNLINVSFSFFFSFFSRFTVKEENFYLDIDAYSWSTEDRRVLDRSNEKEEKRLQLYSIKRACIGSPALLILYFCPFSRPLLYHHSFTHRPPHPQPPYCFPQFKFLIRHFESVLRKIEFFFLSTGINLDANIFKVYSRTIDVIVENTLLRVRTRLIRSNRG